MAFAAPPGRLVDIGTHRLHLHCTGSGAPAVILEAGAAEGWYSFHLIQGPLSKEFRVCSYDRAGFGYSDPRPGQRTVAGILEDLHELLARSGEKGPFLLAGHSLGGELVFRYYLRYPNDVAGLVLIDSSTPGARVTRPPEMQKLIDELNEKRPKQIAEWKRTGKWPEMWAPPALPEALRREVLQLSASQKWWEARYAEGRMPDGEITLTPEQKRVEVPMAVIAAQKWDRPEGWSDESYANWMAGRLERKKDLATWSKRSELIEVDGGHHVHVDRPELVMDAIRRVALNAPGRFVDVGGRRLHLYCTGSGSPTVILEAGAASGFHSYWDLQPRIPFRACSYDRAGLGFSDGRPGRRISAEIATDLHELLQRAGENPPFVLVGHSLGATFVRKFAELYPEEVTGMVLLDSGHEDEERLRPPEFAAAFEPIRKQIQAQRAKTIEEGRRTGVWPDGLPLPDFDFPEPLKASLQKQMKTEKWWQARHSEAEMYEREPAVAAEKRRLDVPLVVFTSTAWKFPGISDEVNAKWMAYRKWAGDELASRSPRGEHIVLDVNHGIHWDAPDKVLDAIRRVAQPSQE